MTASTYFSFNEDQDWFVCSSVDDTQLSPTFDSYNEAVEWWHTEGKNRPFSVVVDNTAPVAETAVVEAV